MDSDIVPTRNILKDARLRLLTRGNVVATGIGYKITKGQKTSTLSVVCSVVEKLPSSRLSTQDMVPETINGIPTDVVETGRIREMQSRTDRYRPAPGGVSIGHRNIASFNRRIDSKACGKGGRFFARSESRIRQRTLADGNDARGGNDRKGAFF